MPPAIVPGHGPSRPRLIIVGEAPGKEEEKARRPFVGRAGRFLRSALLGVGIAPDRCYFTNVVKFRPTERGGATRAPDPSEIAAGTPALRRELARRPGTPVLVVGRTALAALFGPEARVSSLHGATIRKEGRAWHVSYHPSAAMRFTGVRRAFLRDLRRFFGAARTR